MKPKYNINDIVENSKNNTRLTIIDYEIIDNVILYYTDDLSAYPEEQLQLYGLNWFKTFLSYSDEERNEMFLKAIGEEIKFD